MQVGFKRQSETNLLDQENESKKLKYDSLSNHLGNLSVLPNELIVNIVEFLSNEEKRNLDLVCKAAQDYTFGTWHALRKVHRCDFGLECYQKLSERKKFFHSYVLVKYLLKMTKINHISEKTAKIIKDEIIEKFSFQGVEETLEHVYHRLFDEGQQNFNALKREMAVPVIGSEEGFSEVDQDEIIRMLFSPAMENGPEDLSVEKSEALSNDLSIPDSILLSMENEDLSIEAGDTLLDALSIFAKDPEKALNLFHSAYAEGAILTSFIAIRTFSREISLHTSNKLYQMVIESPFSHRLYEDEIFYHNMREKIVDFACLAANKKDYKPLELLLSPNIDEKERGLYFILIFNKGIQYPPVLVHQGRNFCKNQQWAQAIQEYEKAIEGYGTEVPPNAYVEIAEAYGKNQDRAFQAENLVHAANKFSDLKQWKKAAKCHSSAGDFYRNLSQEKAAEQYECEAEAFIKIQHWKNAKNAYLAAKKLANKAKNQDKIKKYHCKSQECRLKEKQTEESGKQQLKVVGSFSDLQKYNEAAKQYRQLAKKQLQLGLYSESIRINKKVIKAYRKAGTKVPSSVYESLADGYQKTYSHDRHKFANFSKYRKKAQSAYQREGKPLPYKQQARLGKKKFAQNADEALVHFEKAILACINQGLKIPEGLYAKRDRALFESNRIIAEQMPAYIKQQKTLPSTIYEALARNHFSRNDWSITATFAAHALQAYMVEGKSAPDKLLHLLIYVQKKLGK